VDEIAHARPGKEKKAPNYFISFGCAGNSAAPALMPKSNNPGSLRKSSNIDRFFPAFQANGEKRKSETGTDGARDPSGLVWGWP
jgi:hypothetical protein